MIKNNKFTKGVSIIEALLAAVIVGIGFVSVYTMTTTATRMIHSSSQRDNDTLSTAMILDVMALDNFSKADTDYHEAVSASKYNDLDLTKDCGSAPSKITKQKATQKLRWCNFLTNKKGGMGSVGSKGSNTDQRKMYVRDITITSNGYSQTYKVMGLRIKHYSFNRNQKKHYMKVLHEE